jgi:NAD(P)-dependent dehydrogenase (short-subunit alcohol dehydrogenase family)
MTKRFEGKVAIVTGAGRGIGAATANRLAADGAKVAVVDRDLDVAEAVARAIVGSGGGAIAIHTDVSNPDAVKAMVDRTVAEFGALHLAVNNAGISSRPAPVADQTLEDWDHLIAVNLSSVFYCLKYEIPAILAAGGGAIVNVSSIFGGRALPYYAPYTAAKHGVVGLTRAVGLEYATQGLRVNALCPGMFDTPMGNSGGEHSDAVAAMIPLKRLGKPEEAAAVIGFLLSDEAAFVNASDYAADAGMLH